MKKVMKRLLDFDVEKLNATTSKRERYEMLQDILIDISRYVNFGEQDSLILSYVLLSDCDAFLVKFINDGMKIFNKLIYYNITGEQSIGNDTNNERLEDIHDILYGHYDKILFNVENFNLFLQRIVDKMYGVEDGLVMVEHARDYSTAMDILLCLDIDIMPDYWERISREGFKKAFIDLIECATTGIFEENDWEHYREYFVNNIRKFEVVC